ncbi:elongation of very long chain fatty acids protein-like [Adelges cooleyi]|uniref:elongation of very long chain fatty acids protein-like n=1 Tax=Adelges cooleyi TaxID=133065 RepID=UPI00217F8208|nr:elongation of very long chain fatty acids protein-like [Adelges cooleyi]
MITMSWFEHFDELLGNDWRTKDWPMMSTTAIPIMLSIIYILFIKVVGPNYMAKKKPYQLRKILMVYNSAQIISCIYLSVEFMKTNPKMGCDPLDTSDNPNALYQAKLVWWTSILKLTEYIETVFFVLRKKQNQVSALHIYHHITTYALIWIATKINPGGIVRIPVILNCIVHMVMYSYYMLSSMGPKIQKKIDSYKKYITIIQMVQFCFLIVNSLFFLAPECSVPNIYGLVFIPNVFIVFYMFYNFYKKSYSERPIDYRNGNSNKYKEKR